MGCYSAESVSLEGLFHQYGDFWQHRLVTGGSRCRAFGSMASLTCCQWFLALMPLQHAPLLARYDVVHRMTLRPPMPIAALVEHFCTKKSIGKSKLRKVLGYGVLARARSTHFTTGRAIAALAAAGWLPLINSRVAFSSAFPLCAHVVESASRLPSNSKLSQLEHVRCLTSPAPHPLCLAKGFTANSHSHQFDHIHAHAAPCSLRLDLTRSLTGHRI